MKITKGELRQMINESVYRTLNEGEDDKKEFMRKAAEYLSQGVNPILRPNIDPERFEKGMEILFKLRSYINHNDTDIKQIYKSIDQLCQIFKGYGGRWESIINEMNGINKQDAGTNPQFSRRKNK